MSEEYQATCGIIIVVGLMLVCVGVGMRFGAWLGALMAGGILIALGVAAYLGGRGVTHGGQ